MIDVLEIAFAEMDKEVLAKQIEWARGRKIALVEFKASEEYQVLRRDVWVQYARMWEICGGKTWFRVFSENNDAGTVAFVTKNCTAIAKKRNANIVAKLAKQNITEIGELKFDRTSDGFHGWFIFEGARIHIQTILAGGYNVQCLHQRTLVKVTR